MHAAATLVDQASEPYRNAGLFAYKFARGKLRGDPVFRALLERAVTQKRLIEETRILSRQLSHRGVLSDLHHQRRKRDFFATVIRQTLEPPG